ncbi:MAG: thioesterase family protein [Pseudomonadota bacterium]
MKPSLREGLTFRFRQEIGTRHTVPCLLPESPEFQLMPSVLATGYMVALVEWACILALKPHLDWPVEQSLGVGLDLSHSAATPPGLTVEIGVRLERMQGRRLTFAIEAHDGRDEICRGSHHRFVVERERFCAGVEEKARQALADQAPR